jgi:hypothetical protein
MISTLGQKLVRQLLNKWTCHKKSWQRINFAGPYGLTTEYLAKYYEDLQAVAQRCIVVFIAKIAMVVF